MSDNLKSEDNVDQLVDVFEVSGSTADYRTSDDILRELCGDEPGEAIIGGNGELDLGEDEADCEQTEGVVQPTGAAESFENFDAYLSAHSGQWFVFHLETYPDESRYPRPAVAKRERKEVDLAALIKENADKIKVMLRSGTLFEDQLEELKELESNGKVRETVLKEIDKAFGSMDGEFDRWKKEGMTDPWKGRIVSFAWSFAGEEEVHCMLAPPYSDHGDEFEAERELLTTFWALQSVGVRAGWGISDEEDKWIIARSMILGVISAGPLDTSKYSNKQMIDIRSKLFPNHHDAIPAKYLAPMISVDVPSVCTVAADTFGMVEARDFNSVREWSAGTVAMEKGILNKMKRYVRT